MIPSMEAQVISLIMSVFAGLAVGVLFDLYRTFNYYTRPSKAFLYFMDLLFWIITGSVVFVILLKADFAELRVYTFTGMGIGIFIYFKLFTEYILKFYRTTIYVIIKLTRITIITVIFPFKLLYSLMWTPINLINKHIDGITGGIKKRISLIIKKIMRK